MSNHRPIYAPCRGTAPLEDHSIRLLIADRHGAYRKELCQACTAEKDLRVIAEAETGLQAIDLARELKPDVILMDIRMPLIDGVQATSHILAARPETAVILMTMVREADSVLKAIQAGARAHLSKDTDTREIVETIRAVHQGETYIDSQVTARVLEMLRRGGAGSTH